MSNLENLQRRVKDLYEKQGTDQADWAGWLYPNHVLVVERYADQLQQRFGGSNDLARAAALLHDIADATTKRRDPGHADKSLAMARDLLGECAFTQAEIAVVVDDAIRLHSCHDDDRPQTIEGKILSTADALAHFRTDFYLFATSAFAQSHRKTLEETKAWTLEKLDRDYHIKIQFDEVRAEVQTDYEMLKDLFGR